MAVPPLDGEARRRALAKAAEARRTRADVKRALKQGEIGLSELFDRSGDSEAIANLRVTELLQSIPDHGPARAARLMAELDIASSRRVRGLGPRQRRALIAAVGG
ncbi:MAG: hypothetical protein RLZZ272_442 [Actinomycetota bacterium]|jgi:hypothetical protein